MQHYHLEMEDIPEYINALKYAQKQSKWELNPITAAIVLLIATDAMLSTERFPHADEIWEDLIKDMKNWAAWENCTRQLIITPRSRNRLLESKTNLGQRMDY